MAPSSLLLDFTKEVPFHVQIDKPGREVQTIKWWKTDNLSPGKLRQIVLELMAKARFLSNEQVFITGNSPVFQD